MTACPEIAPLLLPRGLDLLEPPAEAEVEAHLAACDGCRRAAEGRVAALLDALTLPPAAAAPDGWEGLAARIAAERDRRGGPRVALACSFCRDALERAAATFCGACLAPHHDECFAEHGRCSAPGCGETRRVRAAEGPAPARRRRWAPWVGLLGAGAVAAVAALTPPRAAAPAGPALVVEPLAAGTAGDRVRVDVRDAPAEQVFARLAAAAGRPITCRVADRVSFSGEGPWREVLDQLALLLRCSVEVLDTGALVIDRAATVSLRVRDADLRKVLVDLAEPQGVGLILDPALTGTVTVDVDEVHWLQAMHAIVRTAGDFTIVEERHDLLRIVPTSSFEPMLHTELLPLRHVRGVEAEALARLLRLAAEQRRDARDPPAQVALDPAANGLVITATRPLLRALQRLVERHDRTAAGDAPGAIVSVRVDDADVRQVLLDLAEGQGQRLILAPEVQGTVSVDLADVHWLRAMNAVVQAAGAFELVEEADGLLRAVARSTIQAERVTEVVPLRHVGGAEADVLVALLERAAEELTEEGDPPARVALDPRANGLVITATRPLLRELLRLVERHDRAPGDGPR
ncbi:MAG: hypothetical protein M9894_02920 [Planctomycetes bacterium]|nr:hypothetical protein [Planctomycetota bacterium]